MLNFAMPDFEAVLMNSASGWEAIFLANRWRQIIVKIGPVGQHG